MTTRLLFAAVLLASPALAGPPLTTIQDVLYKADGTRFNGAVTVSWTSFEAIDSSAIATQSTTVTVVDGNLRVQLVPTTSSNPPAYYTVKYNSDGRIQFQETWSVPSSAQPLRVRDVRVASSGNAGAETGSNGASTSPVEEMDVVGLIADLGARPLKGPGYAAGRVAMVNALGALESVSGSVTDCVRVDGSSGPCGSEGPSFVDGDSPAGIVDGSNPSFSLSNTPEPPSSLTVYRNGILMKTGVDYTASGRNIQFLPASAPQPGDTLLASYRLAAAPDGGAPQTFPSPQTLCSGTGAAAGGTDFSSMGTCSIPAGALAPGDRVDIRFDLEHQGAASGFTFEAFWGATSILRRDGGTADALVAVRAEAAILAAGAQLSHQSWGGALAFNAGVASAPDSYTGGITIDFRGKLAQAGDTLTLKGYTVVRLR